MGTLSFITFDFVHSKREKKKWKKKKKNNKKKKTGRALNTCTT